MTQLSEVSEVVEIIIVRKKFDFYFYHPRLRRAAYGLVHTSIYTAAVVVVVVFTLNRSFYPTTPAVPPVSFLILHPREINIPWSQTVRQRKNTRR